MWHPSHKDNSCEIKPLTRLNFVAVEEKEFLSIVRLTNSSQKQLYDRLMLKKFSFSEDYF